MSLAKPNRRFCQIQPGLANDTPLNTVYAYHQRSKHSLNGYAPGPASLDWDAQPNPYRSYEGCALIPLPFNQPTQNYAELFNASISPASINLASIAQWLEYALALAAVKVFGTDSWTVRCNPSSGNLHPTEAYLICGQLTGLSAGVYHYQSQYHQLEQRATFANNTLDGYLYLALTSVHWREAWKYGERSYRYCQLDIGHAIAALRYSAALLGWPLEIEQQLSDNSLAKLCGIDKYDEFAEIETPDLLLRISPSPSLTDQQIEQLLQDSLWFGTPNILDKRPLYEWRILEQISNACQKTSAHPAHTMTLVPQSRTVIDIPAAQLIKQRRSALAFQPDKVMNKDSFFNILSALLVQPLPFDLLPHQPRLHPVLFVHRVTDIAPGLYCLPRSSTAQTQLQAAMHPQFVWQAMDQQLPLYLLQTGDARQISKQISCHQAIASDSAFSLGMLAEFDATLAQHSWQYRELYGEAGVLGQVLYLEAEAQGYRGTGIGCFMDDVFHQLLGLTDSQFQSLYHFTIGTPVNDPRLSTLPPYRSRT